MFLVVGDFPFVTAFAGVIALEVNDNGMLLGKLMNRKARQGGFGRGYD